MTTSIAEIVNCFFMRKPERYSNKHYSRGSWTTNDESQLLKYEGDQEKYSSGNVRRGR